MHRRLGHRKCRTLLAANEHHLWEDAMVCMSLEMGCLSYSIATIKASARNKDHHTAASHPGKYVFLDILHPITRTGLTTKTSYAFYLIIVDAYFPYCTFHSLPDKSTAEVIQAPSQYQADHKPANEYGFIDLVHIWSDAGSQFTVEEFAKHCKQAGITLTLATPKKQHHNHLAECTWQTISSMMHTLLVHGHLPDSFWFHGLQYAAHIFNILPIRGLTAAQSDMPATPWQLFYGTRPLATTFGFSAARSPCAAGLLLNAPTGNRPNVASAVSLSVVILIKRGFLIFTPGSRQLVISDDVIFNENFYSTIALTWQQHKDSLALQPASSDIPTVDTPVERTGSADDLPHALWSSADDANTDDDVPDLVPQGPDDDLDEYDDDDISCAPKDFVDFTPSVQDPVVTPLPVTDGLRHSTRTRRMPARYANATTSSDWSATCPDAHLTSVCSTEAHPMVSSTDAHIWEPAPCTIQDIMNLKDSVVKSAWLASVHHKLKTLVDANTFTVDSI